MRELCEAYPGMTPLVFEQLHPNQIAILLCDKDRLKGQPKRVTLTPQEAVAQGYLDRLPEKSYVQQIREKIARDKEAKQKQDKKQQRREQRQRRQQELKGTTNGV